MLTVLDINVTLFSNQQQIRVSYGTLSFNISGHHFIIGISMIQKFLFVRSTVLSSKKGKIRFPFRASFTK